MKRIAAHRICFSPEAIFKMSYVELSPEGVLQGVRPLTTEIANTTFLNGTVLMTPVEQFSQPNEIITRIEETIKNIPQLPLISLLENTGLHGAPRIGELYYLLHLCDLKYPSENQKFFVSI